MKVYDSDYAEEMLREIINVAGADDFTLEDFVRELGESHEEARAAIDSCDTAAAAIAKGKYPMFLKDLAKDIRESTEDDGESEPEWVTKVLGRSGKRTVNEYL